ncbi:hypothetical protein, partial [Caballeronia mineralivorans]|uniref:hypothetical protein n=1 Tax=Caballeronia mineralivorans TaxID=2010198 RepID=UPI0023F282DB
MVFSGSAAHFDRNWQALPCAFVTPENAEDSFFAGWRFYRRTARGFLSAARAWKSSKGFCTDVEGGHPINAMVNAGWKSEHNRVTSEKTKAVPVLIRNGLALTNLLGWLMGLEPTTTGITIL